MLGWSSDFHVLAQYPISFKIQYCGCTNFSLTTCSDNKVTSKRSKGNSGKRPLKQDLVRMADRQRDQLNRTLKWSHDVSSRRHREQTSDFR